MYAHLRLQQQAGRARVGSQSNDYMRSIECCGTVGDRHHLHCMASYIRCSHTRLRRKCIAIGKFLHPNFTLPQWLHY